LFFPLSWSTPGPFIAAVQASWADHFARKRRQKRTAAARKIARGRRETDGMVRDRWKKGMDFAASAHNEWGIQSSSGRASTMARDVSEIAGRIRTLFSAGALGSLGDGQLLELYRARRDEVAELAFAVLVERHGPMVLGVCRRMLADPEDAADAFQATFLILVQRAAAVRVTDSLGRWLYGVSRRVALQARAVSARRGRRKHADLDEAAVPGPQRDRDELLAALDEEVARLPVKYQHAVLLCDLGGLTHQAAANQLGCPVGTIESRLSRGREMLRRRLIRRGLAPAGLGVILAARSASAGVPCGLSQATIGTALRLSASAVLPVGLVSESVRNLMKGAERAMAISRLKVAAGFLMAAGVLGAGAGVLLGQERRDRQASPAPAERAEPKTEDRASIAALEARLRALEQRLGELQKSDRAGVLDNGPRPNPYARVDPDSICRIRPRFECLVERIAVKVGQSVRPGDHLAELFSADLAAAKNEFLAKTVQWNHHKKLYDLRQKLVATGAISQQLWVDSENEEEKSRHELSVARDRLQLYGLNPEEIDAVKGESGEQKARFTLRAPVGGRIVELGVGVGDLADPRSTLMVIGRMRP
jgi:RNA polymerase sigma factor (sigma-70 family)